MPVAGNLWLLQSSGVWNHLACITRLNCLLILSEVSVFLPSIYQAVSRTLWWPDLKIFVSCWYILDCAMRMVALGFAHCDWNRCKSRTYSYPIFYSPFGWVEPWWTFFLLDVRVPPKSIKLLTVSGCWFPSFTFYIHIPCDQSQFRLLLFHSRAKVRDAAKSLLLIANSY